MPARRRGGFKPARCALVSIACALALSLLALSHLRQPEPAPAAPAEVDAVNWELVARVLSQAPPRDPLSKVICIDAFNIVVIEPM